VLAYFPPEHADGHIRNVGRNGWGGGWRWHQLMARPTMLGGSAVLITTMRAVLDGYGVRVRATRALRSESGGMLAAAVQACGRSGEGDSGWRRAEQQQSWRRQAAATYGIRRDACWQQRHEGAPCV